MKGTKSNWTGHILHRKRLLKHVTRGKIEGKIESTGIEEEGVSSYHITLKR